MKRNKEQLKEWFRRGKYPTEQQFHDWMDSYVHKDENVDLARVEGLTAQLNAKFGNARGEALEEKTNTLRTDFDNHQRTAKYEFDNIKEDIDDLETVDTRQQGEIDTHETHLTTVLRLLHGGATWDDIKASFDSMGNGYRSLWDVTNKLKTFLDTNLQDGIINRWQELEKFLQGITEEKTLAGLLEKMKADISAEQADLILSVLNDFSCIPLTYDELRGRRDRGELFPATLYRITDYVTTVANDPEACSAGHPFDIVVLAISNDTLSEHAWAMKSVRDTDGYFQNANLNAWQLWYSLDNDRTRFQWADPDNGKGVIYRMIDEHGNDCPYDFKNVQFKRYKAYCRTSDTTGYTNFINKYIALNKDVNYLYGGESVWVYTFSLGYKIEGTVEDSSIMTDKKCYNNEIKSKINQLSVDNKTYQQRCLNNIVWFSEYGNTNNNRIEGNCYDMTLDGSDNLFGAECHSIISGGVILKNTFGNYCYLNIFVDCNYCKFGENFTENSAFGSLYKSIFGQGCSSNKFIGEFSSSSLGNNCTRNSFNKDCSNSILGNGCSENTFNGSFTASRLGNAILRCTINCDATDITLHDYVQYVYFTLQTAGYLQHYQIFPLASYGSSVTLEANNKYIKFVSCNTSGVLKVWNPADLVE